jgi:hypothetical protein
MPGRRVKPHRPSGGWESPRSGRPSAEPSADLPDREARSRDHGDLRSSPGGRWDRTAAAGDLRRREGSGSLPRYARSPKPPTTGDVAKPTFVVPPDLALGVAPGRIYGISQPGVPSANLKSSQSPRNSRPSQSDSKQRSGRGHPRPCHLPSDNHPWLHSSRLSTASQTASEAMTAFPSCSDTSPWVTRYWAASWVRPVFG